MAAVITLHVSRGCIVHRDLDLVGSQGKDVKLEIITLSDLLSSLTVARSVTSSDTVRMGEAMGLGGIFSG